METKTKKKITALLMATVLVVAATGTSMLKDVPCIYEECDFDLKIKENAFEKKPKLKK